MRAGDALVMEARIGGIWAALYRFDLQEQFLADYEVSNWYLSNHPGSRFVTQLIVARPTGTGVTRSLTTSSPCISWMAPPSGVT